MAQHTRLTRHLALVLFCACLAWAVPLAARDTIAKLEKRLAREKNPLERARIVARLSTMELDNLATAYRSSEYDSGGARLATFLERIEDAERGLETLPERPRRKSKGYKELEICVRESIRQLRDLGHALSFTDREPIEAVVSRLEKVQHKLLGELFQPLPEKETKKIP